MRGLFSFHNIAKTLRCDLLKCYRLFLVEFNVLVYLRVITQILKVEFGIRENPEKGQLCMGRRGGLMSLLCDKVTVMPPPSQSRSSSGGEPAWNIQTVPQPFLVGSCRLRPCRSGKTCRICQNAFFSQVFFIHSVIFRTTVIQIGPHNVRLSTK